MRIGAHVSAAGGLRNAPGRAAAIGCNCAQVFLSGPTNWRMPHHDDADVEGFRQQATEHGILPIVAHAIYLINLASPDDRVWDQSIESLSDYLSLGARLGLAGVVTHLGSHKKQGFEAVQARLFSGVARVLERSSGDVPLLMEVCAGQGGNIGCRFEELAAVLEALGHDKRLAICLDTAHLYAAGFDVSTAEGLDHTLGDLDRLIGLDRVVAVHANDSQGALGSNLDRHANIGDGHIGLEAFGRILNHDALKDKPFILEVPGIEKQGPDEENVRRLVGLVAPRAGLAPAPEMFEAAGA